MKDCSRTGAITLVLLFTGSIFLSYRLNLIFRFPFPPVNHLIFEIGDEFSKMSSLERPLGSEGGYRDFAGVLIGMRRLTADIAWISVLQYYGMHEMAHTGSGMGDYPALKKMVLRVVRLDPSFHFAYLYGAGSLAFNLNRPQEALELLEEAVHYNPTFWKFRLYIGAIVYKQKGKFDDMIRLLEDAIRYPDCPVLVKSVLGNIYKERENYKRSLEIWLDIAETPNLDSWYQEQAASHIAFLREKLGL